MITEVQDHAASLGRGPLEIAWMYNEPSLGRNPGADVDRHRATFAALEEIGVTSLFLSTPRRDEKATLEFLDEFGAGYLR
jgi:hypothetical protein